MNWAELNEISVSEKATHAQVKYVAQTMRSMQRCEKCVNFIPANLNRCRTVQSPINRQGWCQRFKPN